MGLVKGCGPFLSRSPANSAQSERVGLFRRFCGGGCGYSSLASPSDKSSARSFVYTSQSHLPPSCTRYASVGSTSSSGRCACNQFRVERWVWSQYAQSVQQHSRRHRCRFSHPHSLHPRIHRDERDAAAVSPSEGWCRACWWGFSDGYTWDLAGRGSLGAVALEQAEHRFEPRVKPLPGQLLIESAVALPGGRTRVLNRAMRQ